MSTAVQLLQSALNEYRKAESELTSYRQKAEKSQRESELAIADNEVSDGAAANKLAHAQVISARVRNRETELSKSLGELGQAVTTAGLLLNSGVMELWIKRRAVIGKRAVEALQAPDNLLERGVLDEALSFSAPLLDVRAFEVPVYNAQYIEKVEQEPLQFITTNDASGRQVLEELTVDRKPQISQSLDIEHLIATAELVLANFEKLSEEMKREI